VLDFVIIAENGTFRLVLGSEHSGLTHGRAWVFGAGRLIFDRSGNAIAIDNQSGHYLPTRENLLRSVDFMRDHNVLSRHAVDVNFIE
jgi:hypothetical protein